MSLVFYVSLNVFYLSFVCVDASLTLAVCFCGRLAGITSCIQWSVNLFIGDSFLSCGCPTHHLSPPLFASNFWVTDAGRLTLTLWHG